VHIERAQSELEALQAAAHLHPPQCAARWRAHSQCVSTLAVCSDLTAVCSASTDGTCASWSLDGALLGYLNPHRRPHAQHQPEAAFASPTPPKTPASPTQAALRESQHDVGLEAARLPVCDWHFPVVEGAREREQLGEARALIEQLAGAERKAAESLRQELRPDRGSSDARQGQGVRAQPPPRRRGPGPAFQAPYTLKL
jgi:hypothetical protein